MDFSAWVSVDSVSLAGLSNRLVPNWAVGYGWSKTKLFKVILRNCSLSCVIYQVGGWLVALEYMYWWMCQIVNY